MVLVDVPFASRIWALPVLTALTPSKAWSERHGRHHRPVTEWARLVLLTLRRWLPDRSIVAVMDGEFAALEFLHALRASMVVIARLCKDARLFDPPPCHDDKPGRAPRKGKRQPLLSERLTDPATRWQRVVQASRTSWRSAGWIEYAHGTALWHHGGKPIVPILWVLVRYPDGRREPEAFLCTDTEASPRDVLDCFDRRWAMETTYEEARAHLGVETQRQWSDPAIFRTTPLLLGLYSVITLYVHQNAERLALSPRRAAWYPKPAPTFADALARLRQHLWFERIVMSAESTDMTRSLPPAMQRIIEAACYAPMPSQAQLSPPEMGKVEASSLVLAVLPKYALNQSAPAATRPSVNGRKPGCGPLARKARSRYCERRWSRRELRSPRQGAA